MQGGAGRMSSITQSENQRLLLDFKSVRRKESTMPFNNDRPWSFDQEAIESVQAGQTGVYAIYSARTWIYIGRGDIRQRLLDHLNGDIPSINAGSPTRFRAEVNDDSVKREQQLLREYSQACKARVG